MILVRNTFQAKYGRGDELVQLFKDSAEAFDRHGVQWRILTDVSGPFFTVVSETEAESLGAYEAVQQEMFADEDFGPWFAKMTELVESGRRDFFNIVD